MPPSRIALDARDLPDYLRWPVTSIANATGLDVPSAAMLMLSQIAGWAGFGAGTHTVDGHWVPAPLNQLVALPAGHVCSRVTSALVNELDRLEAGLRSAIRSPGFIRTYLRPRGGTIEDSFTKPTARELGRLSYLRDPDLRTLRTARGVAYRDCLLVVLTRDNMIRAHLDPRSQRSDREVLQEVDRMLSHMDRRRGRSGQPSSQPESIDAVRTSVLIQTTPRTLRQAVAARHALIDNLLARCVHWQAHLRQDPGDRLPEPTRTHLHHWDEWAHLHETATDIRRGSHGAVEQTPQSLAVFVAWEADVLSRAAEWPDELRGRLGWCADLPYQLFSILQLGCHDRPNNAGACARLAVTLAVWVIRNAMALHHEAVSETKVTEIESHADRLVRKITASGSMSWRELLRSESVQRKDAHQDVVQQLIRDGRLCLGADGRFTVPGADCPTAPANELQASG